LEEGQGSEEMVQFGGEGEIQRDSCRVRIVEKDMKGVEGILSARTFHRV
jgi:hypothetical protein